MKKIMFFAILASSILISWACSSQNPTTNSYGYGSGGGNPPPAGSAVTITVISGPHYAITGSATALSAPITITHGQSVAWDSANASGHPLNIDNGSGTCMVSGQTTFPFTQAFSTAGTYPFHCGVHSSCGNGTCGNSCTGLMVGVIQVN